MGDAKGREVVFRADPMNEQVVLAAEIAGGERSAAFREEACRHPPDSFLVAEHAAIHKAVREALHRKLAPDPATLVRLSNGAVDITYLTELMASRPDVPADETLRFALEQLAWDRQKHVAVTGPVDLLLQAIQSNEGPERCRGLARAVAQSFDGWGDRRYLHDPAELARDQIADLRARQAGLVAYPFGLPGLDFFEPKTAGDVPERRLIPGAAPALVTIITGWSGSGKSTLAARLCLGLARQGRRVLYGAWEPRGGPTLELMACMSLNLSRSRMHRKATLSEEEVEQVRLRMLAIGGVDQPEGRGWVRFMGNPFGRVAGAKESNERNLDVVQGYIADSGCDVFVADLFERCICDDRPSEEKRALFRAQGMFEEQNVHGILLAQQSKAMEGLRPTMAGIKGSGGWYEIGDNVFGVHRPYLFKPVPDNVLEIDVLKQRSGVAPLAVELDWDADRGMISGGRSIEYERATASINSTNPIDAFIKTPKGKKDR